MNKKLIVTVGLLVVVIALATAGVVAAQTPVPPTPTPYGSGYGNGYGYGMMGGNGRGMMGGQYGYGMMGGYADGAYGPMHGSMFDALAKGLGITREELDQRVAAGETPAQIAASLGFSQTDFFKLMTDARSVALDDAVAKGNLTQEQANWMRSRMGGRGGYGGYGGNCPHFAATPNP
ncbi:MAG TPA: hypothetical protein VJL59_09690 [Anaerolineales bacterium]|nr:hypothetical protein [Anaerolineales bacterium]HLB47262.1 hypothetical protein [Anaerolineales bacterium]